LESGDAVMETLLSVGIDLGTTTTQMVVSELTIENTASAFSVPAMEIRDRQIRYRSEVRMTPLLSADTIDSDQIERWLRTEYEKAGILPAQVQTGAVIITGETARKENARQVLHALSDLAGSFVVATAGPALESVLAAKGAGADRLAMKQNRCVLHIDIGGGTSNFALFDREGKLQDTGCINVGGRLLQLSGNGRILNRSKVLDGLPCPDIGQQIQKTDLLPLVDCMVQALEEAAGLRKPTMLLEHFITDKTVSLSGEAICISFSGGVADLIEDTGADWLRYGDLGVLLGSAIRRSKLCAGDYVIAKEAVRATVIGAGSHATELSGSTVFCKNVQFPLQNIPVISVTPEDHLSDLLRQQRQIYDVTPAILVKVKSLSYRKLAELAETISHAYQICSGLPVILTDGDYAKALGQAVWRQMGADASIVCLDGLHVMPGCFLDIQQPVGEGSAVPVIVKTLAFQ